VPTFVVVDISIHDPATYERYKLLAPPSIGKYGGRYAVRGGVTDTLEGAWEPQRLVILEFPSAERARAWWNSPEYAEAKAIRQSCAKTDMVLIDGPALDPAAGTAARAPSR
jgi:uncharacterized protein (DUF1330 family)